MRLIDADELYKYCDVEETKDGLYIKRANILTPDFIKSLSTVDAVPVIRCEDCKHGISCSDGTIKYCMKMVEIGADEELYLSPNHYCGFAERKTND